MKKTMNITAAILAGILTIGSLGISVFAEPQGHGDANKGEEIKITEKREKKKHDKNRQDCMKKISPLEAKEMLEKDDSIILLDVRTTEEHDEKHIPNSINLPIDDLVEKAPEVLPDKEATIIVYCKLGKRSKKATRILCKMGYKNVYNLGGIQDWPYGTEKN